MTSLVTLLGAVLIAILFPTLASVPGVMRAVEDPAVDDPAVGAADDSVRHDPRPVVDGVVDLASCDWTRDGVRVTWEQDGDVVPLASERRGTRWATVFSTEDGYQARLRLDWIGGPDGYLYELLLDGQRVPPARDAWRPSVRPLRSDLGSVWLGPGRHLIEFIAREQTRGALHLSRLRVERLDG